ncbi:mite allergen Lep d 7 [Parasteatoda tepidariorum]|uniref:mite allergen Lep d 7 n=1 Tax=Parasteatoda tepidariorum TaxID=114398 RepID=UPI001C71B873|nr:uncharacterized protein LOC107443228 [Parasteatoda tepidariorum]
MYCLTVIFTIIVATYNCLETDALSIQRGNAYIDKLISEEIGYKFDPYLLDDVSKGFVKKIVYVNVTGEAKLHNGLIYGLNTIHRASDCSLTEIDGRLNVSAVLGAGLIAMRYEGTVRFMNYGPKIDINGIIHYVEVLMDFSVNATSGLDGELHRFAITELNNVQVWISGLGPLNWMINPMLKMANKVFRGKVHSLLEGKVESHISERLPKFQFPVEEKTN